MLKLFFFSAVVLPDVGANDWIKLNKDQVGYYRVNYPESMWLAIGNALTQDINVCNLFIYLFKEKFAKMSIRSNQLFRSLISYESKKYGEIIDF